MTTHLPPPVPPVLPEMPPLVARSPEDLLALVPVTLGFHPQDSLVMLTAAGSGRPFHGRIDLPEAGDRSAAAVAGAVAPLRAAAAAQGVTQAVFVLYTPDRRLAVRVATAVEEAFADVGVLGVMRVHGGRWRAVAAGREGPPHAYEIDLHPFAVQAVVEGAVVLPDRASLQAPLAPDPAATARVAGALARAPVPVSPGALPADVAWAVGLVDTDAPSPLDDEEVARLVRLLADVDARDAVWLRLTRERAPALTAWWADVVRRTPQAWLADPACLLAFTAWLAGQGALAWCAVDRCRSADPAHSGGALVAALLQGAVPPTDWEEMGDP